MTQPMAGCRFINSSRFYPLAIKFRSPKLILGIKALALLLIIAGQLNYLPARLDYLRHLSALAQTTDSLEIARQAYGTANYDLLAWVARQTPPDTTLLLLTASPRTYGDPAYVLYHRAIYALYPRSVWWAAPAPPTRYPAWWLSTNLTQANILAFTQQYHATAILADGFDSPPVPGSVISFDQNTHLIFLGVRGQGSGVRGQVLEIGGQWSAVGGFFRSLGALFSIWLWGDLFYGLWSRPGSRLPRIFTAWLLGCGITSLATFLLLWMRIPLTPAVISLSVLGCLLWLLTHFKNRFLRSPAPPPGALPSAVLRPPALLSLLFTLLLILQISLAAFAAWASPLSDWDAWVNWASKANAVFIDQTLAPAMYHNPARLPTNQDYPLLLPLVEAWFYTWLGHIYEPAVNLISLLFYLALLVLFYHASRLLASPTPALGFTVLLATLPRLEHPASSGLADIPLAALVLLSFLLLTQILATAPRQNQSPLSPCSSALLLLLAFSTGLLPWLKNEGWLWWGLISLSLLMGLGWQVKRKDRSPREAVFLFLIYFLPALAIPLLWQIFLTLSGTYRFTFLSLTLTNFWTNLPRLPLIGWHLLTRLLNPYWNFVWLFAGLLLLSRRQRVLSAPVGWLILPITGYLLLVTISYIFSRFDPFLDHLNNSAERLILQATPLLLWWLLGQSIALGWFKGNSEELEGTEESL
jgi:hypothetical protein